MVGIKSLGGPNPRRPDPGRSERAKPSRQLMGLAVLTCTQTMWVLRTLGPGDGARSGSLRGSQL